MTDTPDEQERYCCPHCFTDYAVKAHFDSGEDSGDCDFCGAKNVRVLSVSDVAEFLDEGIARKYENAAEHIPVESAEGGYQWDTLDVEEILRECEEVFEDAAQCADPPLSEVLGACSSYVTQPLVEQHPFSGPGDYVEQWEKFCEVVRHQSRFTLFLNYAERAEAWLAGEGPLSNRSLETGALSELWHRFDNTLPELTKDIPAGKKFYRARMRPAGKDLRHEDLTSPPSTATLYNRMSPVGISYFYGAEDVDTAVSETRPHVGAEITVAEFETVRGLDILDLVDLPPRVSIFDGEHYWFELEEFMKPFLMDFSDAIAQPVAPGDEPLEYVPTQVFCEFIKNNYWRHPVHGIRYKSALKKGGVSVVLLRGPEVSLGPDPWLAFQGASRVRITAIINEYSPAEAESED